MKKLLAVATLALSIASFGAWEKIGTVQIADLTTLVGGITKLGEFTGNQMLGLMASGAVSKMPCVELFGPGREGVPFALALFWDGKKSEYAVLYPVAQTQEEFLAAHPGKIGKDGVITPDEDKNGTVNGACHVLFSQDGKWAAFGDKKAPLADALEDIKFAERPMKGDLAKLVISKNGMKNIRKMMEKAEKGKKKLAKSNAKIDFDNRRYEEMLQDCESLACGLSIDDKGLAVRGTLNAAKGSKLAQCGLKPLGTNLFAFAGKDALSAYAVAADCGQTYLDFNALRDLLAKHGFKTEFLAVEEKDNCAKITLDIPAAVAYFKGATNELKKVDEVQFKADLKKLVAGQDAFKVENPAMSGSIAIKDFATTATPAERVKTVLPEIAEKQPYNLQVFSLYAIIKAVLPHVLNGMEPTDRAAFAPIVATLPAAGNGGVASAIWSEKDAHKFLFRISADEFKSVSAGFSAFGVYQMQKKMPKGAKKPYKTYTPKRCDKAK